MTNDPLETQVGPEWEPIKNLVPDRFTEFMLMGIQDQDNGEIYLYKHIMTRRYLNIDWSGQTYIYRPDYKSYFPISKEEALKRAFS